jgi:uncharacterized membrane protein
MTVPSKDESSAAPLQFDHAELGGHTTAVTCTRCDAGIKSWYYEANGQVVCASCRGALQSALGGSGTARFASALGLGLVGAVVGAVIYFAVTALTGFEFSLISILVGFLVGKGVNVGSKRRGGWRYQVLAVVLTYFALGLSYVGLGVKEMASERAQASVVDSTIASARIGGEESPIIASNEVDEASDDEEETTSAGTETEEMGAGAALLGMVVFAFALPVLANMTSIIGLFIIGIALYYAWQINKREAFALTGPYRVGVPREGAPPAGA